MRYFAGTVLAVAGLLLQSNPAWALGAGVGGPGGNNGGYSSGSNNANFKPGSSKTYSWMRMTFEQARNAQKPICLYMFDNLMKQRNNVAKALEVDLLDDEKVVKELTDFTYVMINRTTQGWPDAFGALAENGAVVVLMTADGKTYVDYYNKDRKADVNGFIRSIMTCKAANEKAKVGLAEILEKEKAEKEAQAKVEAAKKEEGKKPAAIPGLGMNEGDKKPEDKKPEGKKPDKKTMVEEEE
ncbi:MAG: hypothetical protein M5U26_11325 [Planctomycetota bacterium]|nr:hypothetical protein [Planctomycetota bacterium]